MATQVIYALGESQITVSDGEQLSGITSGNGAHLDGVTITLNSNNWEAVTIDDTDANFQDSDNSQTLEGTQVFDGETYTDNSRVEAEYGLVLQDPDGNTYNVYGFNINEGGGVSYGTVEGLAFQGGVGGFPPIGVPLTVIATSEGPSTPYTSLATPLCFSADSMIATPSGQRRIQDLKVGDFVNTYDSEPQPIRQIWQTTLPKALLENEPRFRPVRIRTDSFGEGIPRTDVVVSPQHRILITGWQAQLLFGQPEILVPAIKLVNDRTVICEPAQTVEYFHLLLDQHHILNSNGLLSESYLPNMDNSSAMANELMEIFPTQQSKFKRSSQIARPCVDDLTAKCLAQLNLEY
ncbi:hypothetical protein GCM10008927_14380 [Amylibacter ulvae]|uniref:Hedgehog/Intein (Hint) domain-containing protein n=1 Tax=Paramylibacter ulvae TaxID=1651968 RepID=A0ABQ3D010_9RHOB|nr:Hint domain-containing protein [Amylibacter ulvae]GHA50442.1 hypothetical protein GCM10008927_14380 [Amylibacter ulvae]